MQQPKNMKPYRDINNYYLVTCYHSNPLINYLNITAKWYISKKIQNKKHLLWDKYIRFVKFALTGERRSIKVAVDADDILAWSAFSFDISIKSITLTTII